MFFLWKNCDFRQVEIPGGRGRGSRSLNPKPRFITETIYVQIFSSENNQAMKISRLMTVMILVVSKRIVTHESEAWSSLPVNSLKLRVRVKILEGN